MQAELASLKAEIAAMVEAKEPMQFELNRLFETQLAAQQDHVRVVLLLAC